MCQFQHHYSECNKSLNDCKSIRYNVPTFLDTAMSVLEANSEYFKIASTLLSRTTPTEADVTPHYPSNKKGTTYLIPLIYVMLMMFPLYNNVVSRPIQTLKRSCQRP